MAYLVELTKHKCRDCSKAATHQVVDRWNGKLGFYCHRHGKIACAQQARAENSFLKQMEARGEND